MWYYMQWNYHSKWSKSDRGRQKPYDITYVWSLKEMIQMNLCTKEKQTHRYRKQTCGYRREEASTEGQIRGLGLTDTNHQHHEWNR